MTLRHIIAKLGNYALASLFENMTNGDTLVLTQYSEATRSKIDQSFQSPLEAAEFVLSQLPLTARASVEFVEVGETVKPAFTLPEDPSDDCTPDERRQREVADAKQSGLVITTLPSGKVALLRVSGAKGVYNGGEYIGAVATAYVEQTGTHDEILAETRLSILADRKAVQA
jgi:hypothetical protein